MLCPRTCRSRARCALLTGFALFALWYFLGFFDVRTELLGHSHAVLSAAAAAAAAGLYAPDAVASAAACPPRFDTATGFGGEGPRLWLWWTATTPGSLPATGGSFLAQCYTSVLRHAPPQLRVTLVNASSTRGAGAAFPLRRFPLPPYFDALPVNHQGDFGSFALLAEFGGLYVDTDVLVLHSLEPYVRLLARYQFIGFGGHTFDEGVHHGLMAARPGADVLARAYHAALAAYASEGGCAGATCARLGGLRWLSTLDAFSREAKAFLHGAPELAPRPPCAYLRLPTRHYEPGLIEHQDMCLPRFAAVVRGDADAVAADPEAARYVASTMAAAAAGVLRVTHLSTTKGGAGRGEPLEQCPLLGFLLGVSLGRPDLAAVQRVAGSAVGAWEQVVQDFIPL